MIQEFIKAFLLIFVAEMGDKTQILAMAFATQYPVKKVLAGIFAGVLLNHGLAVVLGSLLSTLIPLNSIQIIAGFAFVGFALWTLKPEADAADNTTGAASYGPVVTVAAAFFIGELGDKTQLAVITLSVDTVYPLFILAGAVLGMLVTGGMGIFIGKRLGDRTPDFVIKLAASGIFLIFGVAKLIQTLPSVVLTATNIVLFVIVVGSVMSWLIHLMLEKRRRGVETAFRKRARELHAYYQQINESVSQICLDNGVCLTCRGNECLVGYTKTLIEHGMAEAPDAQDATEPSIEDLHRVFDPSKTLSALKLTLAMMQRSQENMANRHLHRIRRNLETILFNRYLEEMPEWPAYEKWLTSLNQPEALELLDDLKSGTLERPADLGDMSKSDKV
ncbi:MAG: TMEM165/GDT1 family protein [Bacillota bacterium]|nr:TMEM165/GDT1 family protein [Bacillota bacterium]MDW7677301.1 TMEM165/GDT1 family protein [Bacillota bacterium]